MVEMTNGIVTTQKPSTSKPKALQITGRAQTRQNVSQSQDVVPKGCAIPKDCVAAEGSAIPKDCVAAKGSVTAEGRVTAEGSVAAEG